MFFFFPRRENHEENSTIGHIGNNKSLPLMRVTWWEPPVVEWFFCKVCSFVKVAHSKSVDVWGLRQRRREGCTCFLSQPPGCLCTHCMDCLARPFWGCQWIINMVSLLRSKTMVVGQERLYSEVNWMFAFCLTSDVNYCKFLNTRLFYKYYITMLLSATTGRSYMHENSHFREAFVVGRMSK